MIYPLFIARREARMKSKDLAEALHMHPVTYSNKENGKSEFTRSEMLTICRILGKSLDELFREEVPHGRPQS